MVTGDLTVFFKLSEMKPFPYNIKAYRLTSAYLAYFVTIFTILFRLTIRKSLMTSGKNTVPVEWQKVILK